MSVRKFVEARKRRSLEYEPFGFSQSLVTARVQYCTVKEPTTLVVGKFIAGVVQMETLSESSNLLFDMYHRKWILISLGEHVFHFNTLLAPVDVV